jgi:hypothetical protein
LNLDKFFQIYLKLFCAVILLCLPACMVQQPSTQTFETTTGGGTTTGAFVNGGNTFGAAATLGTSDAFGLSFLTSGISRISVNSAGSVGIGTSSPLSKLHVEDNASVDLILKSAGGTLGSIRPALSGYYSEGTLSGPTAAQSGDTLMLLSGSGYGATTYGASPDAAILMSASENYTDAAHGSHIAFETTTSGTTTRAERMRITNAGRVGIGAVSPGAALDVQTTLNSAAGTDYGVKISPTINGGGTQGYTGLLVDVTQTAVGSGTKRLIDARIGGSSAFSIDSSGNLTVSGGGTFSGLTGITTTGGVTSSAWKGDVYTPTSAAVSLPPATGGAPAVVSSNIASTNGAAAYFYLNANNAGGVSQGLYIGAVSNAAGQTPTMVIGMRTGATSYAERMRIDTAGNVGIGVTGPTFQLELSTDSAGKPGTTTWTITSDERVKDIRAPFERGLKELEGLRTIYFKYKKDNPLGLPSDKEYVGVTAQDVLAVIPEAVSKDKKGYYHVTTDSIIWTAINAIKELYHKWFDDSQELHREIASLKNENELLKERMNALERKFELQREKSPGF